MPYLVHPLVQRTYHEASPLNIHQNWGRADTFTQTKGGRVRVFLTVTSKLIGIILC